MSPSQQADCLALLTQRCTIKDTAAMVGVSEWDVADLILPCRKPARASQRRPEPAEA